MIRKSLFAILLATAGVNAHADLGAGDLAFTAFNADEDGFAMATFVDIAANSTVYFTDNEWRGSSFNSGEGYLTWMTGGDVIAAGSVIRFSAIQSTSNAAATYGSVTRYPTSGENTFSFSSSGEAVYAYLGTSRTAPTVFLSAIASTPFDGASSSSPLLTGTGLSVGNGAVQLSTSSDYAEYTGDRSSQAAFADYKALVSNAANWTDGGDGSYAAVIPNTTAFTVAAVPEPETYAMMLAGLGLMGVVARRKAA